MQVNGYSLPANEVSNRFSTRSGKGVGGAIQQNPPTRIRLNGNIVRRTHDTLPISQAAAHRQSRRQQGNLRCRRTSQQRKSGDEWSRSIAIRAAGESALFAVGIAGGLGTLIKHFGVEDHLRLAPHAPFRMLKKIHIVYITCYGEGRSFPCLRLTHLSNGIQSPSIFAYGWSRCRLLIEQRRCSDAPAPNS